MGQVHPASSRQMSYIKVAIKYLTKWTKVKTLKNNDVKTTAMFLYNNIIIQLGCPKILVSNRGSQL